MPDREYESLFSWGDQPPCDGSSASNSKLRRSLRLSQPQAKLELHKKKQRRSRRISGKHVEQLRVAPSILWHGKNVTLPLPSNDNSKYKKNQVVSLALKYSSKIVIQAIARTGIGPRYEAMNKWFPNKGKHYDNDTLRMLLKPYTLGTPSWKEKVKQISHSEFGPSVHDIYAICGYTYVYEKEVLSATSVPAVPAPSVIPRKAPAAVFRQQLPLDSMALGNITNTHHCRVRDAFNINKKRQADRSLKSGETDLKHALIDTKGEIKSEAVKILLTSLNARKTPLREDKHKLLGTLLDILYQNGGDKVGSMNVLNIKGRGRGRRKKVVVLSEQYNRKTCGTVRTKRRDASKVRCLMQIFDPDGIYTESFVTWYIKDHPELMKKVVSTHMMANRFSPAQSIISGKLCGMNPSQRKSFDRLLYYHHRFRVFSPANKTREYSFKHLDDNNKTLKHEIKTMKRTVNSAGKKTTRDVPVLVTVQSPGELVLRDLLYAFDSGIFLPSEKSFKAPFSFEGFDDAALFKISGDAGNSSFKLIMNLVNVLKPQSLEHVRIILEFSGVKDTYYNVVAAAFEDGSFVKFELEAICQRRLSAFKICIHEETQMVVTINTDKKHDHKKPIPLPYLSGVTFDQASQMTEMNKIGIISIDVSTVASVKVCCDSEMETAIGVSYFGHDQSCIGTVYFPDQIECNASEYSEMIQSFQIVVAGMFVADIDFMSTFLGHQGSSARFPCVYCLAQLKEKIRMWETNSPEFPPRTGESIDEGFDEYKRNYSDLPLHQQTDPKRREVTQKQSHSTIARRIATFPDDAIGTPLVHLGLGNSLQFLTGFLFKYFNWLEMKMSDDANFYQAKKNIQDEFDNVVACIAWMYEDLDDLATAINGREARNDRVTERMADAKDILENPRYSGEPAISMKQICVICRKSNDFSTRRMSNRNKS